MEGRNIIRDYYALNVDIAQELSSFDVENKMNDYIKVQKSVLSILEKENYFGEVTNKETGLIIDIGKKGIKETLGSGKRFQYLPRELKELKIATLRSLPYIIRNAHMIIDNVRNKHGDASDFVYFGIELLINKIPVKITVDVKKTSAKNKFWIHYVNITKENSQLLSPGRTKDINEIGNSSKISLS